jgi:hypothetical protein
MKVKLFTPEIQMIHENLTSCLEDWEKFIPKPLHSEFSEEWKNDMKRFLATSYPVDDLVVESAATGLLEAYTAWTTATNASVIGQEPVDHEQLHALMSRPQTAQRTMDWYKEFQKCLTASEIYKAFGSPRERGILVMQKAGKIELGARGGALVVYKEKMTPFDWGICFEPVVKLILESSWGAMIHECGRFVHSTESRLAASPDGLILRAKEKPEVAGHLLEIKCPKSRKIGVKIPMEYFYQMQLQMEVTGLRACEYVEAKFEMIEDPAWTMPAGGASWCGVAASCGRIAVIGCFCDTEGIWTPCKYMYGPVNDLNWKPDLGLNEQTLQINTWYCPAIHHETVLRDITWFNGLWPKLHEFWADIEKARAGEFVLPDSSRKKKDTVCEIQDSDTENGN